MTIPVFAWESRFRPVRSSARDSSEDGTPPPSGHGDEINIYRAERLGKSGERPRGHKRRSIVGASIRPARKYQLKLTGAYL
jgi:hypothetical protein